MIENLLYLQPWTVVLVLLGISALYFHESSAHPLRRRLFMSAHGVLLTITMLPIAALNLNLPFGGGSSLAYLPVTWLALVSIAYSWLYPIKHRLVHGSHIATLFYGALAGVYGASADGIISSNMWFG